MTDPAYAPCISKTKAFYYWIAPRKDVSDGYPIKRVRLEGKEGDGLDMARAAKCRQLTAELMQWREARKATADTGSFAHAIAAYRAHPASGFNTSKHVTRASYARLLDRWGAAIGATMLSDVDFDTLVCWRSDMVREGRSVSDIHRMFTMLRSVVTFAMMNRLPGAKEAKAILSAYRVKAPIAKSSAPTKEQVEAIIEAARRRGETGLVLAWSLQWTLSLRAVDVRGQWEPTEAGGKRWLDGLTWDMISHDLMQIRKVLSKSQRHDKPTEKVFPLDNLPEIRAMLSAVHPEDRVGPVIRTKAGLPFEYQQWRRAWAECRKDAGVPVHVQNMDSRAASLTHAVMLGADPLAVKATAGHRDMKTTTRYIRDDDRMTGEVIRLRFGT